MTAVFVTGSGTGIGKTALCVALLAHARRNGLPCAAYKPVATGFDAAASADSDTGLLLAAQGRPLTAHNLDAITPWRFAAPLAADVAARLEHRAIDFDALVRFCRGAAIEGVALIEGIGGVMVPLTEEHTVLDWIVALDAPALLVVGSYLGAISHALTAASVLLTSGATVAGIVVNQSEIEPMPTHEVAAALARFVPGVPIEVVTRASLGTAPSVARVWTLLEPHLRVRSAKRGPPAGEMTGGQTR